VDVTNPAGLAVACRSASGSSGSSERSGNPSSGVAGAGSAINADPAPPALRGGVETGVAVTTTTGPPAFPFACEGEARIPIRARSRGGPR
jgi:hypothetical protein